MSQALQPRGKPAIRADSLLAYSRDSFLVTLRQAAGEVIRHPGWLDELTRAAGECFDELAGLKERKGFEQAHGMTASRISLVHDEDLDYSIELMNLDQRLRDHCVRELSAVHLRMRTLLAGTDTELEDESPVGAESVCRALRALKEAERLSPAEALTLLAQLEEPLQRHLGRYYRDLEHQLADAGIASHYRAAPTPNPTLSIAEDWAESAAARRSLPIHPLDALRLAALARREAMPQNAVNLDPGLASALLERIEAWLGERQQYGEGVPASLGASELSALLAPSKAAAVEVVEAVCAYASANPRLPATIRAILAQLRVPLLRLALRSETLLASKRHPALLLLDLIANLGRTLPANCAPELPVCRALMQLVQALGKAPRLSEKDFAAALDSAENLVRSRQQAALARAAVLEEEACRLERREVALHQASRAIYLMVGHEVSTVARDFVEGYWVHVLAKAAYRYGTESPQWAARVQTANRLLASANPDPAARPSLQAQLPELIRDLEQGLAYIGLTPDKIQDGLAACREMHAAILAGRPLPASTRRRPVPPFLGPVGKLPHFRVLKHKQYFAGELPLASEWAEVEPGGCVAVGLPDGTVMRGFVAFIGPLQHILLLADGDSEAVLAITGRALAQQIGSPQTRPFHDDSLVDEAATEKLINP
jgi:hypothetical protein